MADIKLPPGAVLLDSKPAQQPAAGQVQLPPGAVEDTGAIPQQTTEGMNLPERLLKLGGTAVAQAIGATAAVPQAVTQMQLVHTTPEDLKQAHDEWNAAHPHGVLGPYTYNPEIQARARELAIARDPKNQQPLFGKTVEKFGQQHLVNADEGLQDVAKVRDYLVGDIAGKSAITNPTEASGRVYQAAVRGATSALPALATGQPELIAAGIGSGALSGTAGQVVRETGGSEAAATGTEILTGLLGGVKPSTVLKASVEAPSAVARAALKTPLAGVGDLAEHVGESVKAGIDPTLLTTGASKPAGWAAQAARSVPVVGGVIEKDVSRALTQGEQAAETVAGKYGTATSREAGAGARQGVREFYGGETPGQATAPRTLQDYEAILQQPLDQVSFADRSDALYAVRDSLVPQGQRFQPNRALDALNEVLGNNAVSPELAGARANPDLVRARTALVQTMQRQTRTGQRLGVPYEEMKQLRTDLGEGLRGQGIFRDVSKQQLSRVYEALTQDMDGAVQQIARQTGDNRIVDLTNQAQAYYRQGRQDFNKLQSIGGETTTDEQAFRALHNAALGGAGKGDLALLQTARRSMRPEQWNDVAAGMIREMWHGTPGASTTGVREFAPTSFVSNFAKYSDDAKNVVFGPRGHPLRDELENLARVLGRQKAMARLANASNTLSTGTSLGIGGLAATGGLLPAAKVLGYTYVFSKMMTSSRFVKWLANYSAAATPQQAVNLVRQLPAMARAMGIGAAETQALVNAFQQGAGGPQAPQQPPNQQRMQQPAAPVPQQEQPQSPQP